jgi:hypothetical protein
MTEEISRRTLLIGIAVCLTLMVSTLGCAFYFEHHHQSLAVSAETAEAEFLKIRERFAGQRPLLDMGARKVVDHPTMSSASAAPTNPPAPPIRVFHTVIFDTRGGSRLIHLTAPYRFARLFAHRDGRFRWLGELTFLDDTEFDPEPIQLSIDDLKRRGPGLIVDFRHPGAGQFIAWVE